MPVKPISLPGFEFDYIDIGNYLPIVDSREFQTKRSVKQLGTVDVVYNGATHNVKYHLLYVFGIGQRMAQAIGLNERGRAVAELCNLVHDLAKTPYMSVQEDFRVLDHEDYILKVLENFSRRSELEKIMGEISITDEDIRKMIKGEEIKNDRELNLARRVVNDHVIDADRIAYTVHDVLFTDLEIGYVNPKYILNPKMMIWKIDDGELCINGMKGLNAIMDILGTRLKLYDAVYYHKTCRAANVLVNRARRLAVENKDFTLDDMVSMTDGDFESALLRSKSGSRELMQRLRERKLPKLAVEMDASEFPGDKIKREMMKGNASLFRRWEEELEEETKMPVFIDMNGRRMPENFDYYILIDGRKIPIQNVGSFESYTQTLNIRYGSLWRLRAYVYPPYTVKDRFDIKKRDQNRIIDFLKEEAKSL